MAKKNSPALKPDQPKNWADQVLGLTVAHVGPMSQADLKIEDWTAGRHNAPTVLTMSDGTKLYAARDPEGNGPGCLFGVSPTGANFRL